MSPLSLLAKGGKVMLSKDKIIGLGYHMMEEIDEADSLSYKEEIFNQLEIVAYILDEDMPKDMYIFIKGFRGLL